MKKIRGRAGVGSLSELERGAWHAGCLHSLTWCPRDGMIPLCKQEEKKGTSRLDCGGIKAEIAERKAPPARAQAWLGGRADASPFQGLPKVEAAVIWVPPAKVFDRQHS